MGDLYRRLRIAITRLVSNRVSRRGDIHVCSSRRVLSLLEEARRLRGRGGLLCKVVLVMVNVTLRTLSCTFKNSGFGSFVSNLLLKLSVTRVLIKICIIKGSLTKEWASILLYGGVGGCRYGPGFAFEGTKLIMYFH